MHGVSDAALALIVFGSSVASVTMGLLAQTAGIDIDGLSAALGSIASVGFAVWYAWFVTTKTMPEKDRLHREVIDSILNEFRQESKEQRTTFADALRSITAHKEP